MEAAGWGYQLNHVRTRGPDDETLVFGISDGEPVINRDGKCDFNCGCSEAVLDLVIRGPVNMRDKDPDPAAARGFVSVECESTKGNRSRTITAPGGDGWK